MIIFCVLILYPEILLYPLVLGVFFSFFLNRFFGIFYVDSHVICKQRYFYFFLSHHMRLLYFSFINAMCRNSGTAFNILINVNFQRFAKTRWPEWGPSFSNRCIFNPLLIIQPV